MRCSFGLGPCGPGCIPFVPDFGSCGQLLAPRDAGRRPFAHGVQHACFAGIRRQWRCGAGPHYSLGAGRFHPGEARPSPRRERRHSRRSVRLEARACAAHRTERGLPVPNRQAPTPVGEDQQHGSAARRRGIARWPAKLISFALDRAPGQTTRFKVAGCGPNQD